MRIRHFILTRFNNGVYASGGLRGGIGPAEWTRRRLELFNKYTRPSIEAQTVRDFEWILLVDPRTEKWVLDDLELTGVPHHIRIESKFYPIPVNPRTQGGFLFVRDIIDASSYDYIITTRLDSDDAVFPLFVEKIQDSTGNGDSAFAFDFVNGCIYDERSGRMFSIFWGGRHNTCENSQFVSLILSSDYIAKKGFTTCMLSSHCRIHEFFRKKGMATTYPTTIMIVHRNNICNDMCVGKASIEIRMDSWFNSILAAT
jgi:hypothetical protein